MSENGVSSEHNGTPQGRGFKETKNKSDRIEKNKSKKDNQKQKECMEEKRNLDNRTRKEKRARNRFVYKMNLNVNSVIQN